MNASENYKTIIDQHFGLGVATFRPSPEETNNVIGALNHRDDFTEFRAAFHARLKRLAHVYADTPFFPHLKAALNNLARKRNWAGAYAELVAFDFLNSDTDWLPEPVSLSRDVPATDTLASDLGMNEVNFDGYFEEFGIAFDVKVLSDKSSEILGNVIEAAKITLGLSQVSIYPSFPPDISFELIKARQSALRKELLDLIDVSARPHSVRSVQLPGLSYRFLWPTDRGVSIGPETYTPYQHAQNHHSLMFGHAKKFSKVSPSLIIFVVFPWYSESILRSGLGGNELFYRSFSRRFFCQYAKDVRPAKDVYPDFQSSVTMAEVTTRLSGIIFLEDRSITTETPDEQNVQAHVFLNPNAQHKVRDRFRDYLRGLGCWIDDFACDNY